MFHMSAMDVLHITPKISPRVRPTTLRSPTSIPYRAFSLVELLVVIAIVGLLAGLTIPVVGRTQEAGNRGVCVSNLRGLGQAMNSYVAESGMFPPVVETAGRGSSAITRNWTSILVDAGSATTNTPYSKNKGKNGFWFCPSALKSQTPSGINATTYSYSSAAGGIPVARVSSASKMAMIMDGSWSAGTGYGYVDSTIMPLCCHPPTRKLNDPSSSVNVCFVDGHVEMMKNSEIPTSSTNVFWTGQN
jgi:prepilin-type N-terminal cleavage/methylation domain-containing protein/prepilin-type processing-associated H-X9-DG protein